MIRFESVSKTYQGGFQALKNVSFAIAKGEMIFIAGHSGAGKSTVLKLISGITRPSGGRVLMNKQDIGRLSDNQLCYLRQHIGIVFQDHKILFDRNVLENVLLPLRIIGYDRKTSDKRARRRAAASVHRPRRRPPAQPADCRRTFGQPRPRLRARHYGTV